MTQLRKKMLEELQRRNYAQSTAKQYVRIVREFALRGFPFRSRCSAASSAASSSHAGLKRAFRRGKLLFPGSLKAISTEKAFRAFLRPLSRQDWVVYAKPLFGGPAHVLQYLARYTHRVAISNHRLLNVAIGEVTFRWEDYAHGNKQRNMTVSGEEFLRRFLLHVLPKGFIRIRFFGFLAPRRRAQLLPLCQQLLAHPPQPSSPTPAVSQPPVSWHCPRCGGAMKRIEKLTALQIPSRLIARRSFLDTS